MVKVVIDDARGMVQSAGSGVEISNTATLSGFVSANNLASTSMRAVQDVGVPLTLTTKRTTATVANASTTTATTGDFIPAGAMVVAASVSVVIPSAGGNDVDITDIGSDGDADLFNDTQAQSLDLNTAGGAMLGFPNTRLLGYFAAADEMMATYGTVGTQTTEAVLAFTIWYYDFSVVTGS